MDQDRALQRRSHRDAQYGVLGWSSPRQHRWPLAQTDLALARLSSRTLTATLARGRDLWPGSDDHAAGKDGQDIVALEESAGMERAPAHERGQGSLDAPSCCGVQPRVRRFGREVWGSPQHGNGGEPLELGALVRSTSAFGTGCTSGGLFALVAVCVRSIGRSAGTITQVA